MRLHPIVIAIGGCSGSGKSTLAHAVAQALSAEVLPVDAYYRDLSSLEPVERARFNFDDPSAIDAARLEADLAELLAGRSIRRPVYDFATHCRTTRTELVSPADAVILEGVFALVWEPIRRLCTLTVFMDLDDETCFARRLERDVRQRGRTEESVREQYDRTVRPMAERHILPTRQKAELVVWGADPVEENCNAVVARLSRIVSGTHPSGRLRAWPNHG